MSALDELLGAMCQRAVRPRRAKNSPISRVRVSMSRSANVARATPRAEAFGAENIQAKTSGRSIDSQPGGCQSKS